MTNQNKEFQSRHIGISKQDEQKMLDYLNIKTLDELTNKIVPQNIARTSQMQLPHAASENQALEELKQIADLNQIYKSHIGQGYYPCHTPTVILRNILENPAWYTSYTPYQAEISQGRMEALLNFQTMICDLTGLAIANASMLDEATAAAEAMTLARRSVKAKGNTFLIHEDTHPQTINVIKTRATPLEIQIKIVSAENWQDEITKDDYFAALIQYPASSGDINDYENDIKQIHTKNAAAILAADILSLTLIKSPAEMGADIAIGNTQRFGMPMGAGGPHAAYMACKDEYKRSMPGRLVGVSIDAHKNPAYRLALQTREQHIRREKATSNICTAQALPAIVASMYAVYHGAKGLKEIAQRINALTYTLKAGLEELGYQIANKENIFDTITIKAKDTKQAAEILMRANQAKINLRDAGNNKIGISLDETSTQKDIQNIWQALGKAQIDPHTVPDAVAITLPNIEKIQKTAGELQSQIKRQSQYLTHPVFNAHTSETAMLRYIRKLSDKDLALDRTMIALGSCTMKLNATSEMIPITWEKFANIHPFAPADQQQGYTKLNEQLSNWLAQITGYAEVSLEPNAGSQGEYAGLLAIKAWQKARGEHQRNICLIPSSAHGTNPASAQMAGLKVIVTPCDAAGNVDMQALKAACEKHSSELACIMITYPSTHGVFEEEVKQLCELVHQHGGKVYVDGANMNALVGLAAMGEFGGDVSHLNLHKTFCIPHGGGGPGVGPVCVAKDLVPYLPRKNEAVGAISAAPLGNASVLPISWMYIRMMGADGLKRATQTAILSANYISQKLKDHYPTLYKSQKGLVAHECILDLRGLKETSAVMAEDVAKRLADYGFHAPTLSFPVANTLMCEPTESEPLEELDRFIDAMIQIRQEIKKIEDGTWPQDNNPLKNAPHTAAVLLEDGWNKNHPYNRKTAAAINSKEEITSPLKYWPPVGRIDNVHGDRNLFCTCPPIESFQD